MSTAAPQTTIQTIALDKIHPSPLNPRKHFDEGKLVELTSSILSKGVRSPLEVRPAKKAGTFELIAGERRWRASQRAGLEVLPCIVTECTDAELVELALTENGQRDDLTPMDEARSFAAAMKANPKHYTVAVVAAAVGKSESHVYRRLKLLELADDLQTALDEGRLSIAHAEKLMRLPVKLQKEAASLDGRGVVWSRSPLLRYNEKWVPAAEDLMPLAGLEKFIRVRSHFDPASKDTRHLQPELIEHVGALVADGIPEAATADEIGDVNAAVAEAIETELASLIELSLDPMARTRIGAAKSDKIPLTPSKWKEVKGLQACAWARRGVVTHGGEAKVLVVCTAKGKCAKHWPAPKKVKASASTSRQTATDKSWEERNRIDREKADAREARWKTFGPALISAIRAALSKVPSELPTPILTGLVAKLQLPKCTTVAGFARAVLEDEVQSECRHPNSWREADLVAWAKMLGVDVKAFEPKAAKATAPKATIAKKSTKKAAKKGARK